jgi:transcriptional regulator with XRE-family HTH domain
MSAQLIRQARTRAGINQTELAERVGKSKVQVGRWENGLVAPSLETLLDLLRACGFTLPLRLESYAPVDDSQIVASTRLSPGARVDRLVQRVEQERQSR